MPKASLTFSPSDPIVGQRYSCLGTGFKPGTYVSIFANYPVHQETNGPVGIDGTFDLSMSATAEGSILHTVSTNPQGPGQPAAHELCSATLVVGCDVEDPPLVEITWRDAFFDFDQRGIENARHEYLVRTVGYVVSESPNFLTIAQELLPEDDGFRALTHVPRASIHSRTTLGRLP